MPIWAPLEPDFATIASRELSPMDAIVDAQVPGAVVRGHYPAKECGRLLKRIVDRGLIRDPDQHSPAGAPTREDVGSSLSNLASSLSALTTGDLDSDREVFLVHSATTHELFAELFDGLADPVAALYDALSRLFPGRKVMVAREPDGRRYGPAIFRVHYGGHAYSPHTNHVRVADHLYHMAVSRFTHQLAALICFRNGANDASRAATTSGSPGVHATIYRTPKTPEIQRSCETGTFHDLIAARGIDSYTIEVEPGDFYLFNSGLMHEVPAVQTNEPRVVLAAFVGYSAEDEEVFVWA